MPSSSADGNETRHARERPHHVARGHDREGEPREGIGSLPEPQRSIAERIDALAAETLPALQRSVKWGMAWYGVGDGWCFACGGFAGHVKLVFGRGTSLSPVPPVTPIGMGKTSRGVELASVDDVDERQLASWMTQATALPGFGKR
jgi:hypothetical protein